MAVSPFTEPGTKIVAVVDIPARAGGAVLAVAKGTVLTVDNICRVRSTIHGETYGVKTRERDHGPVRYGDYYCVGWAFTLDKFDLAALPKVILDCLEAHRMDA